MKNSRIKTGKVKIACLLGVPQAIFTRELSIATCMPNLGMRKPNPKHYGVKQ
jgi:hypothetical protein